MRIIADFANFFENASLIAVVAPLCYVLGLLSERALGVTRMVWKQKRGS